MKIELEGRLDTKLLFTGKVITTTTSTNSRGHTSNILDVYHTVEESLDVLVSECKDLEYFKLTFRKRPEEAKQALQENI